MEGGESDFVIVTLRYARLDLHLLILAAYPPKKFNVFVTMENTSNVNHAWCKIYLLKPNCSMCEVKWNGFSEKKS